MWHVAKIASATQERLRSARSFPEVASLVNLNGSRLFSVGLTVAVSPDVVSSPYLAG